MHERRTETIRALVWSRLTVSSLIGRDWGVMFGHPFLPFCLSALLNSI
jgi:hypothetical protein